MSTGHTGTTLLFVDDSVTDRVRGVGIIRKSHPDWHVIPADDGEQALQILGNGNIDIVVSDVVMPGVDGRELLRIITNQHPLTPVVLITAQGDDQMAAECLSLGAVNYVPKRRLSQDLAGVLNDVVQSEREAADMRRVLQHVVRNRCEFEIDSDVDEVRTLANFVQNRLHAYNVLSPQQVRCITAAVRECLLNAHYHGNLAVNSHPLQYERSHYIARAAERYSSQDYSGRKIRLCMLLEPTCIQIQVADDGAGFDQQCLQDLQGEPNPQHQKGNGTRQIRAAVDSFTYNPSGNEVTLVVRRDSADT